MSKDEKIIDPGQIIEHSHVCFLIHKELNREVVEIECILGFIEENTLSIYDRRFPSRHKIKIDPTKGKVSQTALDVLASLFCGAVMKYSGRNKPSPAVKSVMDNIHFIPYYYDMGCEYDWEKELKQ